VCSSDLILQIQPAAVNVSDESVEKMVSESVEFAFSDMAERVWTEARLKAEELLPAVDSALVVGAQWLSEQERERIDRAVSRVREVMPSKQANALKEAVQELDKATESLAAKIVEQAMEQSSPAEWEIK
jgi:molecular chaperone DnaK